MLRNVRAGEPEKQIGTATRENGRCPYFIGPGEAGKGGQIKNPGGVRAGVICRPSGLGIPPLSAGNGPQRRK